MTNTFDYKFAKEIFNNLKKAPKNKITIEFSIDLSRLVQENTNGYIQFVNVFQFLNMICIQNDLGFEFINKTS